jgi:F0F1-type ATP synthase membrane subunit c/vacuolar-type H+-ATPase subunit K
MYSIVNCLNKTVNCTDIQCCISQAIGVIGAAGLPAIARNPEIYENATEYTQLLINTMYSIVNCSNKSVNCTDIQCCISTSIGVIGSAGSFAISRTPSTYEIFLKPYTQLLINNMYSKTNCSNKSVNCKDIQCCISKAIDVIDFSETIYSANNVDIQHYTEYLKSQININCK